MNEKSASILNPSKTPPKRALDFALNRVSLIAGNPLLPLHLRITKAPRLGHRPASALPRRLRRLVVGRGGAV